MPCERIEIVEAAHPVPDEAGRRAAERLLERVGGLGEADVVLCLISGGGSALLPLPAPASRSTTSSRSTGALLGPDSLARAWAQGMKPQDRLADNDGHGFFSALGDSFVTGPTLTNVNDFRALLIDAEPR